MRCWPKSGASPRRCSLWQVWRSALIERADDSARKRRGFPQRWQRVTGSTRTQRRAVGGCAIWRMRCAPQSLRWLAIAARVSLQGVQAPDDPVSRSAAHRRWAYGRPFAASLEVPASRPESMVNPVPAWGATSCHMPTDGRLPGFAWLCAGLALCPDLGQGLCNERGDKMPRDRRPGGRRTPQ